MALEYLRNWMRRRGYEKAVAFYRQQDNQPLKLAHAIRHLGDVHYDAGKTKLAEQCFLEALELYCNHDRGPSLDFANAVRRLAVLRDDAGETEAAIKLWQETHDRYAAVNEPMGIAESAGHLALLTRAKGDVTQSQEWLNRASAAAKASAHPPSIRYVESVKSQLKENHV